jgi:ATP-dependent helicase HepA
MNGLIVLHRTLGFGKIISTNAAGVRIKFCGSNQTAAFGFQAFQQGDLEHARLVVEMPARTPRGLCVIVAAPSPDAPADSMYTYAVRYADGLTEKVNETEVTPLVSLDAATPVGQFSCYSHSTLHQLVARENFVTSLEKLIAHGGGVRALTASRIDLYAHQAYVVREIILDPLRRYILADEVGLGKTIEAGVVVHDLLLQKPNARILVLTPGALCRQWLCEMYSSFGGQDFRLLDLHAPESVRWDEWRRIICSTSFAVQAFTKQMEAIPWDMIVIDEVHHLLDMDVLYAWVARLSQTCRDLLLLSALPARSRESEFLKLLQLLEPKRYARGQPAHERFTELYEAQGLLSRRINRLSREIQRMHAGDASALDVLELIDNLLRVPVLSEDPDLKALRTAASDPLKTSHIGQVICDEAIDRYRINRRILRNRRAKLIELGVLVSTERAVHVHSYTPSQAEMDTSNYIHRLLLGARQRGCPADILRPFTRMILTHLASAESTWEFLVRVRDAQAAVLPGKALEFLRLAGTSGYDNWELTEDLTAVGARGFLSPEDLSSAVHAADVWRRTPSGNARCAALAKLLRCLRNDGRKILVFAGLRGLAQIVAGSLTAEFGEEQVAQFTYLLSDDTKEKSVSRFRQEHGCWIMVSDETGGEGRNFQFADILVHLDLPWAVSPVEQRIGRLDRLGRTTDVVSHVVLNAAGFDAGWHACLKDGFGVFTRSISGIEFSLRNLQERCLDACLDGVDALVELAPTLASACEQERAADEVTALVDESSRRGAATIQSQGSNAEIDAAVEKGFLGYFRSIASNRAVRAYSDDRTQAGLWTLSPEEVRNISLPMMQQHDGGLLSSRVGTFSRQVARVRRDKEFFCFGNALFDAVSRASRTRAMGRSYAVSTARMAFPISVVFDIQVFAEPDLTSIDGDYGLINRARLVIDGRRIGVQMDLETLEIINNDGLNDVARRIRSGLLQARDLTIGEIRELIDLKQLDWSEHVRAAVEVSKAAGRAKLSGRYAPLIDSEVKLLSQQRRRSVESADALCLLQAAIENWKTSVDSIGLIAFR